MVALEKADEHFAGRRAALESGAAELARLIARWDEHRRRDGNVHERRIMDKGLEWAQDILSLKTAALARAAGDAAASREWLDEAYAACFDGEGIYSEWGLDARRIDPRCAAAGVHELVLCPAVLRKEAPAGAATDAIVELCENASVHRGALRRLARELARQLGGNVNLFLFDEIERVLPDGLAYELLTYGVCLYHEGDENE